MPRCKAGEVLRSEAYFGGTPQMDVFDQEGFLIVFMAGVFREDLFQGRFQPVECFLRLARILRIHGHAEINKTGTREVTTW